MSYSDKFSSQSNTYANKLSSPGTSFGDKFAHDGATWDQLTGAWSSYLQTWDGFSSTLYNTKY